MVVCTVICRLLQAERDRKEERGRWEGGKEEEGGREEER